MVKGGGEPEHNKLGNLIGLIIEDKYSIVRLYGNSFSGVMRLT